MSILRSSAVCCKRNVTVVSMCLAYTVVDIDLVLKCPLVSIFCFFLFLSPHGVMLLLLEMSYIIGEGGNCQAINLCALSQSEKCRFAVTHYDAALGMRKQ